MLKHTTRTVKAVIKELEYQVDVNSLDHYETPELGLNEIGRIHLRLSAPVMVDRYRRNRTIGVMKSEVHAEDGRLLASAVGSYSIFTKAPRAGR